MLQRKQTVFYLIAIVALLIPLANFSLVTFTKVAEDGNQAIPWEQRITLFGNEGAESAQAAGIDAISDMPLFILNLVVVLLLVVTIFSFRKLANQARLGRISLYATLISIGVLAFAIYNDYQYTRVLKPFMDLGLVVHFFVIAVLFILAGNWGVRSDQKLLASVDRIR